ncbi:hypothetical protein HY623_04285 [Candidatus Uhrbacteria bacterium]|nr:hypothetical protein [Candidatus Uhrbacteria bacterium]
MASSIRKFFSIGTLVLTIAVAGCDLFGAKKAPSTRESRATPVGLTQSPYMLVGSPSTQTPTPTPTKIATPNDATPVAPITTVPPTPSPSATGPWATGKLVTQGNGLQLLKITGSGGFAGFTHDERTDVFAMAGLDGEVYVLVYRWWFWIRDGGVCHNTPKVFDYYDYRNAPLLGAAVFRVALGDGDRVQFIFVSKQRTEVEALKAGYSAGAGCGGDWNASVRRRTLESLWQTMPATPAHDVAMLSSASSASTPARLSEQAEGRWGSSSLSLEGLPWYPGEWYPDHDLLYDKFPSSTQLVAGVRVDHGIGYRSAFAFRYGRYKQNNPPYFSYGDDNLPGADDGPLWRLNKGDAAWRPLRVIPWGGSSMSDQGNEVEYRNIWNNVLWSDLHKRWFFWVGSATGSVFVATEESAAKLR